jgi:putative transposase
MLVATRIRLYPDPDQEKFLIGQFGAMRWVWNKALWAKKHAWKTRGCNLSPVHDMKKLLAVAKRTERRAWLKAYDAMALQEVLRNLEKAYVNFLKGRAKYPRFKTRDGRQSSYHCTGALKVGPDWVQVPKLKSRIRAVVHREIPGVIKSITLSRTSTGKFYASVLSETGIDAPAPPSSLDEADILGIDLGLTDVIVTSTGRKFANPRCLNKATKNLRRKQRRLSRCKKGSKNRRKARLIVAKAHERVANVRSDFQHKLSREIVAESQGAIAVETLSVRNMLKNRKLSRAISDVGWSELVRKISYKSERAGIHMVRISQWEPTTPLCSICKVKGDKLALSVRTWECACGAIHDRDINASMNVAHAGKIILMAGGTHVTASGGLRKTADMSLRPMKEEKKAA